jgi:hypothetical protein
VSVRLAVCITALGLVLAATARNTLAEPYIAIQQGYKCIACHVDPTGGGLRNEFGTAVTENVLPQTSLPTGFPVWTGHVLSFLQVGADGRWDETGNTVPNESSTRQSGIPELRAYGNLTLIPDRLSYYLDEELAPGNATPMEYYGRYNDPTHGWYIKGGQFYLPFGWRVQDNSAFVREVSGISMTTPDRGFELGLERPQWSAQFDYTRGEENISLGSGHEITGQVAWVRSDWRVGAAAAFTQSVLGNREVQGVFAGLRTGRVAWLGEIDLVRDASYPGGPRRLAGGLAEADWALGKGQNLKISGEYYDPDLSVASDQQTRWSLVYEYTPIPFFQLRAGWRRYRGIPQSDIENRRLLFVELHAFL